MANEVYLCWIVLLQAARALRARELEAICERFDGETKQQASWLMTRIKHVAPQRLVVAA
jgi:HPt (histidine-containing phosphotransfer) domain-containing protein